MSKINAYSRVLNRKGKTWCFVMDFLLWTALTWLHKLLVNRCNICNIQYHVVEKLEDNTVLNLETNSTRTVPRSNSKILEAEEKSTP